MAAVALLSGCRGVPVWEQQTLTRAQMQFTDRMAESNDFTVWATVEPGTANSTGAVSACSACR